MRTLTTISYAHRIKKVCLIDSKVHNRKSARMLYGTAPPTNIDFHLDMSNGVIKARNDKRIAIEKF